MSDRFTVDVISPQFPCGAAWLANALIELNVKPGELWGFDTSREWNRQVDGMSVYIAGDLPWRQTLASLRAGRSFRFREDIRPRFSHAFPWQHDLASAVVIAVRDPRDALYSEWQRHRRNLDLEPGMSFPEFVLRPFFEGPLSIIDMLWLHLRVWLRFVELHGTRAHVLRFEDWKKTPVRSLRQVTQWIGLAATEAELAHAAQSSDVHHLQEVEARLLQTDPTSRQFNRRGVAEEWRETWDDSWPELFGPHWRPIFEALRYVPLPAFGATAHNIGNLPAVLAWRGLTDQDAVRYWTELISREG